ncbi:MAG: thiamine pyrophosphate-binding protein [Rhodospirillaceae bacterium]|nr:thiamine pyrophosphate-binding protein [Rhodospirillaceae bacterium]
MVAFSGNGAGALVTSLRRLGIRRIFGVPGESFISVLDDLGTANDIEYVVTRQEGGASFMAEAEGKLTGKPGVLMLARGPGGANAMAGLHAALQDSTPLIAFVGLIPRGYSGREAFQEIDVPKFFGGVAKWAVTVEDPARLPEIITRAYSMACAGRPGPVVIGLPEDMLEQAVELELADAAPAIPTAAPMASQIDDVIAALNKAERPLAVVGGSLWSDDTRQQFERIASAANLPVATAFRCQDYCDNMMDGYVGHLGIGMDPALKPLVQSADLIFAVGARLDEHTTAGYTLLHSPSPVQTLIHVHPSGEELHKIYQADVPVCCDPRAFVDALEQASHSLDAGADRTDWHKRAGDVYRAFAQPKPIPGDVQLADVILALREALPNNAVISNGAGNYAGWVHRYFAFRQYRTQLAPTSGSMGYGLPAAIAAAIEDPSRQAVAVAGDGCLQMTIQELATAKAYNLPVLVLVVNNGSLGAIRMHQERAYPERVYATDLANPDFIAIAKAYGWHAAQVTRTDQFQPALDDALSSSDPALIELVVPIEALTAGASLTDIRAAAR